MLVAGGEFMMPVIQSEYVDLRLADQTDNADGAGLVLVFFGTVRSLGDIAPASGRQVARV